MSKEKREMLKYILWINLALGIQNIYFYVNNDSLFNLLVGSLNIGVWVFFRNQAGNKEWILGLSETIIVIGIAFFIGFVNDQTKPKMYHYKNSIVTVYKKYQCPNYCKINHYHYVYHDSTIVFESGMLIDKDELGERYKPEKEDV